MVANGAVLWVDDTATTFRDNDDIGFVWMVQNDTAGSPASKKIAYPWFGLLRVETNNQPFAMLAYAMMRE